MTIQIPKYLKPSAKGVVVDVLVAPRASRTKIIGEHGERLKIALKAPPVDGAANEMLIKFLAQHCQLPAKKVTIVRGAQSKRKSVLFEGITLEQLSASLECLNC